MSFDNPNKFLKKMEVSLKKRQIAKIPKKKTSSKCIGMTITEYKSDLRKAARSAVKKERNLLKVQLTPVYEFLLRHKNRSEPLAEASDYRQFTQELNTLTFDLFKGFEND